MHRTSLTGQTPCVRSEYRNPHLNTTGYQLPLDQLSVNADPWLPEAAAGRFAAKGHCFKSGLFLPFGHSAPNEHELGEAHLPDDRLEIILFGELGVESVLLFQDFRVSEQSISNN